MSNVHAVVERTGNTPMKLVVQTGRYMRLRMWIALYLIRLAYRMGGIHFEKPQSESRADRRQRARDLAQGSKYASRNQR